MIVPARTVENLLTELRTRGVVLDDRGGKLHYRAPKGALPADLLTALKAERAGILAALAAERAARDWEAIGADAAKRGLILIDPAAARELPRGAGRQPCYGCKGRRYWRSIFGAVVCAKCYPPVSAAVVAEEIDWKDI